MKERYYLFGRFWLTFIGLSLFIGFCFYSQDESNIMWGMAFITFVYTLLAWLLSDELTNDAIEVEDE